MPASSTATCRRAPTCWRGNNNTEAFCYDDLNRLLHYSYGDSQTACTTETALLSLTDPTGYGGKGGFFKTALFRQLVGIAAAALLDEFLLPFVETAAFGATVANSAVAGVANAGIAGGASGAIATGTAKGAAIGAGEALAFAGVHGIKADLGFPETYGAYSTGQLVASAGMHAFVGGLFSMASGGRFEQGFLSAGLSDVGGADDVDLTAKTPLVLAARPSPKRCGAWTLDGRCGRSLPRFFAVSDRSDSAICKFHPVFLP